jgi:hypothetical protein
MAAHHPYITLAIVAALAALFVLFLRAIFRALARLFRRRTAVRSDK